MKVSRGFFFFKSSLTGPAVRTLPPFFARDSWLACPVSFHPCCNLTFCSQSHATMAPSLEKLSSSLRCSGESAARRSAFASNWLNCNKQRADTAYSQKIRSMATRNKYRQLQFQPMSLSRTSAYLIIVPSVCVGECSHFVPELQR